MRLSNFTALVALLPFAVATSVAPAGDLNPPGAPAPTMVTLDQLNSAIAGAASAANDAEAAALAADASAQAAQDSRAAINALPGTPSSVHEITVSGNYYLTGDVVGQAGKSGILVSASFVTIDLNGFSVVGVPGSTIGIDFGSGVTLDGVAIRNGVVRNWAGAGIAASGAAIIRGVSLENVACAFNAGIGANLGVAARATNCVFSQNGGGGLALDGVATNCVATSNTGNGFQIAGAASNCSSRDNTGAGFVLSQATAEACKANLNDGNGFQLQNSVVRGCAADSNGSNGIEAGNRSVVSDSTCLFNGTASAIGAGINTAGGRSIVRGNNVSFNDIGVRCPTAGGNLVAGNMASDNTTNYSVVAGNLLGTVLTTEAAMNAAANDYANFSF
jgi:hypothetical protein